MRRLVCQLAACSDGRVAIWEANASSWRVHSSFVVNHSVTTLDYAQGKLSISTTATIAMSQVSLFGESGRIVAAGSSISVWELDESQAWPSWIKIGTEMYIRPLYSLL